MYTLLLVLVGCPPEKPVGLDTSLPDTAATDDSAGDSGADDSVTAPDSDGDGDPDASDCAPDDPDVYGGAVEVCDGIDQDCDGTADDGVLETLYADGDGDGYGAGAALETCPAAGLTGDDGDCDDADGAVYPGADEACDGIDNDCSGGADEGLTGTLYPDADGDGWGESGSAGAVGCLGAPGMVNNDGDCDDGNPFAYPGQFELCDGVDNDCDGTVDNDIVYIDWYADSDGDGWGDASAVINDCQPPPGYIDVPGDCDDSNSAAFPGAAESCDGLDNDCDGTADEGVQSTFYRDADADAWGDSATTAAGCSAPAGFVAASGDCNDGDRSQNPGMAEVCDSIDNDCSGTADDLFVTLYQDADRDGYGDAAISNSFNACGSTSGYVADATDCDDGDSAVHPFAPEVCDTADQDCDGAADEGVTTTFYADSDGDTYGDPASSVARCVQPVGYVTDNNDCDDLNSRVSPADVEICDGADNDCDGVADDIDGDGDGWYLCTDDCDDADSGVNPGAAEVCYDGADNDCDGTANGCALPATVDLSAGLYTTGAGTGGGTDMVGYSVAVVPDADADGDDEILVGATGVFNDRGAVYLLEGPISGTASVSAADALWLGTQETGYDVQAAIWDDGSSQLLISTNGGDAYIVDATNRVSGQLSVAAHITLYVSASGSSLCCGMNAADLDGDGDTDVLISASSDDANGIDSGQIYLAHGPLSGQVDLSVQAATITGDDDWDRADATAIIPDIDGNGLDDVLVGSWQADGLQGTPATGRVSLLLDSDLPAAGSTLDLGSASAAWYDDYSLSRVGWSICGADMTGDGYTDIAIGAPGLSSGGAGSNVFLISGSGYSTGPVRGLSFAAFEDVNTTALGTDLDCQTDLDGDGALDLVFSDPQKDIGSRTDAGAVYAAYGPLSSGTCSLATGTGCVDAGIAGEAGGDLLGYSIAAGDIDGDSFGDLLLGAPGADGNAGIAYVLSNVSLW